MPRWAVAGVVVGIALLFAGVASSRTADAACSADPPGVTIPKHDTRAMELRVTGWHCVLHEGDLIVLDVGLGWWPSHPAEVWSAAIGS